MENIHAVYVLENAQLIASYWILKTYASASTFRKAAPQTMMLQGRDGHSTTIAVFMRIGWMMYIGQKTRSQEPENKV